MREIKKQIEQAGLIWEAIENFDPAHWYDVLLDGPRKQAQLEGLRTTIRRVGEVGIPIIGYNFSIAGVAGRITVPSLAEERPAWAWTALWMCRSRTVWFGT